MVNGELACDAIQRRHLAWPFFRRGISAVLRHGKRVRLIRAFLELRNLSGPRHR